MVQLTQREENPPRTAIDQVFPIAQSNDTLLFANRSGDEKRFAFRAVFNGHGYAIQVYPDAVGVNPFRLIDRRGDPLLVMTSSESGANNRPMTGDYDLMAVCPTWNDYGNRTKAAIFRPPVDFIGKGARPADQFSAGTNLDQVMDMRTNTGARPSGGPVDMTFQG